MTKPTIYQQLKVQAAAHSDLLLAYRTDLTKHDKKACREMKPGESFIWLMRQDGTNLYPLTGGHDPIWLTYWISGPGKQGNPVACLIRSEGKGHGTVERIKLEEAERLANESWKEGVRRFCFQQGAPHHAPAMINQLAAGGDAGARHMLSTHSMWQIADLAGVKFPGGW